MKKSIPEPCISLLLYFMATMTLASCTKSSEKLKPIASLNIINAISGGTIAKFGSRSATIANNGFGQYGLVEGNNNLYVFPTNDSLNPYYENSKFSVASGEVYSLYLVGTSTSKEGLLIKEMIPYYSDSIAGIRFINLAPTSTPLNITLSTTSTVNEVSNLAYKQITDFKSYSGKVNSTYTFQVRAANTPNTVLTTFALATSAVPRFTNITLVIRQNGTGISVFRVNNDR